jgi:uncharacterized membrane protein
MIGATMKLIPIVIFVLLIFIVASIIRRVQVNGKRTNSRPKAGPNPTKISSEEAIKILNSRYAKGELGKSEYMQMKKDILGL